MDSNHRMAASKAAALPLGYTPILFNSFCKGDLFKLLVIKHLLIFGALSIIFLASSKELNVVYRADPVPDKYPFLIELSQLKDSSTSL